MPELTKILTTKLIPWSMQNAHERFVVARPKMHQRDMPDGVSLVPRPLKGKRVTVRNRRIYKNSRHILARWPESGLIEVQNYKLMCVLEGAIDYPVASHSLNCGSGHFIFFPPGLPHSDGSNSYIDTTKSTFSKALFFFLHPNAIQYWISQRTADTWQQTENALILSQHAIALFHMLMEEIYEAEHPSSAAQHSLLSAFFSLIKRDIEFDNLLFLSEGNQQFAAANELHKTGYSDFSAELERYIKTHLNMPINIETAARAMYLSRAQFTRTVRRETGKSFNEFHNNYRLQEAKVLLANSQWTITFIAESLGFTSADYFRTFFRKHTGKTPSEFRDGKVN